MGKNMHIMTTMWSGQTEMFFISYYYQFIYIIVLYIDRIPFRVRLAAIKIVVEILAVAVDCTWAAASAGAVDGGTFVGHVAASGKKLASEISISAPRKNALHKNMSTAHPNIYILLMILLIIGLSMLLRGMLLGRVLLGMLLCSVLLGGMLGMLLHLLYFVFVFRETMILINNFHFESYDWRRKRWMNMTAVRDTNIKYSCSMFGPTITPHKS